LIDLDQDALNACFHSRRKRLAYRWNATWSFYREPLSIPVAREAIELVRREARIIHFNGNSKPWSYFCDHPRKAEYYKYLRKTEWCDFVPEDRTTVNRLRKRVAGILPEKAKTLLKPVVLPMISKTSPARV
jgi:lipopolysaccharide biosynthesis glycosyltransferase